MAQTNYTPISLYYSTTAAAVPVNTNLVNGELAINITDGKLFYKDNGGTVQVLATKGAGTIGGSNTQVQYNNSGALAGSANLTFNGTTLTANTLNLTNSLGTTYGGTGLTSFTANGVVYASSTSALATGSALTFDGTNFSSTGSLSGTQLAASGPQLTDGNIRVSNTTTRAAGNKYGIRFADSTFETNASIYVEQGGAGNNSANLVFGVNAGTGGASLTSAPEAMRLTSTGLGIGTSSPGAKLGVSDGSTALLQIAPGGGVTTISSRNSANSAYVSSVSDAIQHIWRVSGTEAVRIDTSGNLGLGVTPSAWYSNTKVLQLNYGAFGTQAVSGTTAVFNNAYEDGNDTYKYFSTNGAAMYRQTLGVHRWYNAPSGTAGNAITFTQVMTLNASGNLGLGVTPSAWDGNYKALQSGNGSAFVGFSGNNQTFVVSNAYNDGSWKYKETSGAGYYAIQGVSNGVHAWYTAPSGTAGNAITFTQAMTLTAAGNLQVPAMYGTTVTTPRNVFIDSSGNMGGISSVRASKTNITAIDTANWICQLNPVTFNYRKKDEKGAFLDEFEEERQFGLIAEDVETVKPELCIYVDDKLQGVHYDRMIAPLIKAIQEQQALIQSLTDRIAQLENKL